MKRFFRVTMLWILLLPGMLYFLGAASNQLVLIANHDKFPVMLNEKTAHLTNTDGNVIVDSYGMLDDTHCLMTHDTHLNFLADIFDRHDAYYSVGDGLIYLGEYLWTFMPFMWLGLIVNKLVHIKD
jgi:Family of unknown function (DUF5317)